MIHGLASIKYWNRVSEIVTEVAAEHGVFPKHESHVEAALGAMKPLHNAHYWDWYLERHPFENWCLTEWFNQELLPTRRLAGVNVPELILEVTRQGGNNGTS